MLTYSIQLNSGGVVRFKAQVPAVEAHIVGDYHNHKPYQPDTRAIHDRLPFKYRKALNRALGWWQEKSMSGRAMPLKCDLVTLRGKPLGTLYATPNWVA